MATIYCTATSLDGFIADDDGGLSWLHSTPDHDSDPEGRHGDPGDLDFDRMYEGVGALVMGSTTYEWIREHTTRSGEEFTWPYDRPSWVASTRDLDLPDGVHGFAGDVRELHARMTGAAHGRDLWIVGGGELVGQFVDAGLLDRVWLHVVPVTVGAGSPLLPRRVRLRRRGLERDGQFTAMLFDVVGPEPRESDSTDT